LVAPDAGAVDPGIANIADDRNPADVFCITAEGRQLPLHGSR